MACLFVIDGSKLVEKAVLLQPYVLMGPRGFVVFDDEGCGCKSREDDSVEIDYNVGSGSVESRRFWRQQLLAAISKPVRMQDIFREFGKNDKCRSRRLQDNYLELCSLSKKFGGPVMPPWTTNIDIDDNV